jgi:hypothetical protein
MALATVEGIARKTRIESYILRCLYMFPSAGKVYANRGVR